LDFAAGTNTATIKSTSSGAHNVTIETTNLPIPCTLSLVQNTIQSHSTSNYLYTYIDGELANTQFWSDDMLLAIDMSPQGCTPALALKISLGADKNIVLERLIP
jgi:hypothetical protein